MQNLFNKIPDNLFTPLTSKYKSIYSYCLISLYRLIRLHKEDLKKSEYVDFLKNQSDDMIELLSSLSSENDDESQKQEDNPLDIKFPIQNSSNIDSEQNDDINEKINYIVKNLSTCGWFLIVKNQTRAEKILIPAYSFKLIKIINDLTTDSSSYLPLVHQTYAELKMEDEKEDDYMYRALMSAKANANEIDLSVMLLRQEIKVFGTKLEDIFDPNQVLKQHFDEYRVDVSNKYYHPMKTFDSLGLYSQPTIKILASWLSSERKLARIILNAKAEPQNKDKSEDVLAKEIIKTIQDIIEIFSRLQKNFNEIDAANANYTEAVQKKVNYLSSSDKTIKGKIDKIILSLANEIKNNITLNYDEMPTLLAARDCVNINRIGFLDGDSSTLPIRRSLYQDMEPLPIQDDLEDDDFASINDKLSEELNRFSDSAVLAFINKLLADKHDASSEDVSFANQDNLILMILAILKANLETIPFSAEKLKERIEHEGYYIPLYEFQRIKNKEKK